MVPGLNLFRGAFSAHRDGIAELLLPLCDDRNKLHRPIPCTTMPSRSQSGRRGKTPPLVGGKGKEEACEY